MELDKHKHTIFTEDESGIWSYSLRHKDNIYCEGKFATLPEAIQHEKDHHSPIGTCHYIPTTLFGRYAVKEVYNPNPQFKDWTPDSIQGNYDCRRNRLTSLIEAPRSVLGDFDCSFNPQLPQDSSMLEFAPAAIGGRFSSDYLFNEDYETFRMMKKIELKKSLEQTLNIKEEKSKKIKI